MSVEAKTTTEETLETIWEVLTAGPPAVITSHVRLDGDGLGSSLALMHALSHEGVDATVALQPPTPEMFEFLPGMDRVVRNAHGLPASYNLIVVDCGNLDRAGELGGELQDYTRLINIDHHDSNTGFGDLNFVEGGASSSGEMVYRLFGAGGVPITPAIADCLFTAIVTDTGQFSHQDTTPDAFRVCAHCVEVGAQPHELVRKVFFSPTPAQMKLRHLALGTLRYHHNGRIATMHVTEEMFERTGLRPIDTEGFAELPISVRGVEASALLKEMPDCDYIKVSMRSMDAVDVCEVARSFGGGGHTHAAGCELYDELEAVREAVVERIEDQLPADSG